MRIRLLNAGGYEGFYGVKFPVEVEATKSLIPTGYSVPESELHRIGGDPSAFTKGPGKVWFFSQDEAEAV